MLLVPTYNITNIRNLKSVSNTLTEDPLDGMCIRKHGALARQNSNSLPSLIVSTLIE